MSLPNIKQKLFMLFMCLTPIAYCGNMDTREFQEKFFQLSCIVVVALFIDNFWMACFIILNLILFLLNGVTVGINQVLNVLLGCLVFSASRNYFKNNKFKPVCNILLWLAFTNICWMIMQIFGIDPLFIGQTADGTKLFGQAFHDPVGLFNIKMANGIFLSIALIVMASLNAYLSMVLLIPILLSHASVAVLACYVSTLFYSFFNKRKLFLILVIMGTIGTIFYIMRDQKDDPQTFGSRLPMWHSVFRYTLMRPIGYGPDSFRSFSSNKQFMFVSDNKYNPAIATKVSKDSNIVKFEYYSMDGTQKPKYEVKQDNINFWDNAHNEYIQYFFEYGVFGLIILIGFLREIFFRFINSNKNEEVVMIASLLLVFFVSSLGHFPLHLARLGCLFPVFLGAFYARTDEVKYG